MRGGRTWELEHEDPNQQNSEEDGHVEGPNLLEVVLVHRTVAETTGFVIYDFGHRFFLGPLQGIYLRGLLFLSILDLGRFFCQALQAVAMNIAVLCIELSKCSLGGDFAFRVEGNDAIGAR